MLREYLQKDLSTKRETPHTNEILWDFSLWRLRQTRWRHNMEIYSALLTICEGIHLSSGGFPSQRVSHAELWCSFWCTHEHTVEQTVELSVVWDVVALVVAQLWITAIWPPMFQQKYWWWRHQMEAFSAILALCAGNSPVTRDFPSQRPVTRSFDAFFDLRLNKRLSK